MTFNGFGFVVMGGCAALIILAAILFAPRCEYAVGTVEMHISIGGMLIAGCPSGKMPPSTMILPARPPL